MAGRASNPNAGGYQGGPSETKPKSCSLPQPIPDDLAEQYLQGIAKLRAGFQTGIPLRDLETVEKELKIIQREAARQACVTLRCLLSIHSAKTEEYQRRSGGKDNWYKDWLPAVLQQQQQLERALTLTQDAAHRLESFNF